MAPPRFRISPITLVIGLVAGLALGIGIGIYGLYRYQKSLSFDGFESSADSGTFDHSAFQVFLDAYLHTGTSDGVNRLDYRKALAGQSVLAAYLQELQATDPARLSRQEALAYWLNFYNAGMIQLILARGEFDSVFDDRIYHFTTQHFAVGGQALSLDNIENAIIRVQWEDPRIHYGLNCASISCPNLQPQVFSGATLDRQLDAAARQYINHGRGVAGVEGRRVVVSEIFDWFKEDFGGSDQNVINHLALYAEPQLARQLEGARRLRLQPYDWGLNIATP